MSATSVWGAPSGECLRGKSNTVLSMSERLESEVFFLILLLEVNVQTSINCDEDYIKYGTIYSALYNTFTFK